MALTLSDQNYNMDLYCQEHHISFVLDICAYIMNL